jgi:hypothetical protein
VPTSSSLIVMVTIRSASSARRSMAPARRAAEDGEDPARPGSGSGSSSDAPPSASPSWRRPLPQPWHAPRHAHRMAAVQRTGEPEGMGATGRPTRKRPGARGKGATGRPTRERAGRPGADQGERSAPPPPWLGSHLPARPPARHPRPPSRGSTVAPAPPLSAARLPGPGAAVLGCYAPRARPRKRAAQCKARCGKVR